MAQDSVGWFNALPRAEAQERLRACNAAERFAREVADGRPYADAGAVADAAEAISLGLEWSEVRHALAAHPRIGDRVAGESADARSSRDEQASMSAADDELRAALTERNRSYEARFDHVYLIRAAGRSPAEMLSELHRRLDNDEASERAEVTGQLAEITRLRVEKLVTQP